MTLNTALCLNIHKRIVYRVAHKKTARSESVLVKTDYPDRGRGKRDLDSA